VGHEGPRERGRWGARGGEAPRRKIKQAAQIPDFFTSELGDTLQIVARDARLIVSNAPGTDTTCLNEFPAAMRADGLHVRLGDLSAGDIITLVLATTIAPAARGEAPSIQVRLADRDQALFGGAMDIAWTVAHADANRTQPVNMDVVVAAATLIAERARAQALELNRAGDFDGAKKLLQPVIARIREMGPEDLRIGALIVELESAIEQFAMPMDALASKQAFYQSYNVRASRAASGKARRTAS
jgi:hypothetical protein